MAHGGLKSGGGGDTIRTATTRQQIGGGAGPEVIATLEATEDRLIRAVMLQVTLDGGESGVALAELSRSAESDLISTTNQQDETSAGTIAFTYSKADSTNGWAVEGEQHVDFGDDKYAGGISWDEGEEINLHARNTASSGQAVRAIVYYERKSDC